MRFPNNAHSTLMRILRRAKRPHEQESIAEFEADQHADADENRPEPEDGDGHAVEHVHEVAVHGQGLWIGVQKGPR